MRRNDSALIHTLPGGRKVKRCSGCKELLELQLFSLGSGPGGYHRHCKQCQKAWRAKHPPKPEPQAKPAEDPLPFDPVEVEVVEIRRPHWLSPILDS